VFAACPPRRGEVAVPVQAEEAGKVVVGTGVEEDG
jgi:hypothetical protein